MKNKKKILFISHSAVIGGAEQCLLDLLSLIDADKFELLVLIPSPGILQNTIDNLGIKTFIYNIPWWIPRANEKNRWYFKKTLLGLPSRINSLRKLIKTESIDLVYTNTVTCIDAAIAAKLCKIPHVWHLHEILNNNIFLSSYIPVPCVRTLVGLLSIHIIVPSKAALSNYISVFTNNKISVINNGVNLKCLEDLNLLKQLKKQLNIPVQAIIIGIFGSIFDMKGQIDFVDAANLIVNRGYDCYFLIVGDGNRSYLQELKERIFSYNLQNRIILTGYRNDVNKLLQLTDVVVSASWLECFPKIICEAMAAGKPIVATRCGGPEEQVVEGETGFLVPIKDPGRMANAIIKLLQNKDQLMVMGKKARAFAEQLYDVKLYARKIQNILATSLKM